MVVARVTRAAVAVVVAVCCCLPAAAAVVCSVQAAKYLHSNSIGCVLCLLLTVARIEHAFADFFSIFSMSRAGRSSDPSAWSGQSGELTSWTVNIVPPSSPWPRRVCYANGNSNELPTIRTRMSNALAEQKRWPRLVVFFLFWTGGRTRLGLVCAADILVKFAAALKSGKTVEKLRKKIDEWVRVHCAYAAWHSRSVNSSKICACKMH